MAGKAVEFSFRCDSSEKQPVEQATWSNRRKALALLKTSAEQSRSGASPSVELYEPEARRFLVSVKTRRGRRVHAIRQLFNKAKGV
jgi:hypothetical protein